MGRLPWFKHYNTASIGASFERLRAERDFEAMACYWMLLELLSRQESDDNRGYMEIPHSLLHQTWNVHAQRAARIITRLRCSFTNTMRIETLDKTYKVQIPNWLNLQENRGGKTFAKNEQNDGRGKRVRSKRVRSENNTMCDSEESHSEKFAFEEIYKIYPKRLGAMNKTKGLERLKRIVKSDADFNDAMTAVKNYSEWCKQTKKERTELVKMFSSFFDASGSWREWITFKAETKKNLFAFLEKYPEGKN